MTSPSARRDPEDREVEEQRLERRALPIRRRDDALRRFEHRELPHQRGGLVPLRGARRGSLRARERPLVGAQRARGALREERPRRSPRDRGERDGAPHRPGAQVRIDAHVVLCRDDAKRSGSAGDYRLATRTHLEGRESASLYASTIAASRNPIVSPLPLAELRVGEDRGRLEYWAPRRFLPANEHVLRYAALDPPLRGFFEPKRW